jgi:hypothetical protein
MNINMEHRRFQSRLALLLCFVLLLSSDKGFSDVQQAATTTEVVGKVTGVRSATMRNGLGIRLKDVVYTNDILRTGDSGRVSVELQDGSILSIGSDTELSIVNHDPTSGRTLVNLSSGRLRSRVVKLRSSGKFAIATPHGTITALGTDFFLDVSARSTELIVYSGVVVVTSGSASTDLGRKLVLDVDAGQDVLIDEKGISYLQLTPNGMEEQTIAETTVPEEVTQPVAADEPIARKSSHMLRNATIGGLAAGAIIGAVIGLRGSKSQSATSTPSIPPTIPAH